MIGLSRADKLAVASALMGLVAMVIWMNVLCPGPSWHYLMVQQARREYQAVTTEMRQAGLPGAIVAMANGLRRAAQWWWFLLAPGGLACGLLARRAGNRLSGEVVVYMNIVACAMSVPGIVKVVISPWFPNGGWGP